MVIHTSSSWIWLFFLSLCTLKSACSKHLKGTRNAVMVLWKLPNLPKSSRFSNCSCCSLLALRSLSRKVHIGKYNIINYITYTIYVYIVFLCYCYILQFLLFFICSRAAIVNTWSWKQDLNHFKGLKGEYNNFIFGLFSVN